MKNPCLPRRLSGSSPAVIKVDPVWGDTLKPGYCGFITRERDLIGDGIEYFERFETGLPFCHAFTVAAPPADASGGDCGVIEAHARLGVHRAPLAEYLNDPSCQCFIRIPRPYSAALGCLIVWGMERQLGDKYGYGLILADLLANTVAGHWINEHTRNLPDRLVCKLFTGRHHRICSQAVASALQEAWRKNQGLLAPSPAGLPGCLNQPADTIDPKRLGNDPEIWDPTIYRVS